MLLTALSDYARTSVVASHPDGLRIRVDHLLSPPVVAGSGNLRALSSRLILDLAARLKPHSGQLTAQHVQAILHLAEHGEPGKLLQLPGGLRVRREREALLFFSSASVPSASR
jgi:hypothetical protein